MSEFVKVQVIIHGEIITLVATEDEAYIKNLAGYIDKKVSEITSTSAQANSRPNLINLLVALNIADELFKEKTNIQNLLLDIENEKQKNELLQTLINELRDELMTAQNELAAHKENRLSMKNVITPEELLKNVWAAK